MPIFNNSRTIHVHIPRTGGTSINRLFYNIKDFPYETLPTNPDFLSLYGLHRKQGRIVELDHLTYSMMQDYISPYILENFNKFCVFRNPYTRFVSEYKRQVKENDKRLFKNIHELSLEEYAEKVLTLFQNGEIDKKGHFSKCHVLPQTDFLMLDGKLVPGIKVIKFENLAYDTHRVLSSFGLPEEKIILPKLNTTSTYSATEKIDFVSHVVDSIYFRDFEFLEGRV